MKKFVIGLLAAAALVVPARAEQVYSADAGQWKVIGWIEEDGDLACVAKTFWRDGSQINVNVWDGQDYYTTMTVYNNSVTTSGMSPGRKYEFELRFVDEGVSYDYEIQVQKYGEKVILRNLGGDFFQMFADSETMVLFSGSDIAMEVGLHGTRRAVSLLEDCLRIR